MIVKEIISWYVYIKKPNPYVAKNSSKQPQVLDKAWSAEDVCDMHQNTICEAFYNKS